VNTCQSSHLHNNQCHTCHTWQSPTVNTCQSRHLQNNHCHTWQSFHLLQNNNNVKPGNHVTCQSFAHLLHTCQTLDTCQLSHLKPIIIIPAICHTPFTSQTITTTPVNHSINSLSFGRPTSNSPTYLRFPDHWSPCTKLLYYCCQLLLEQID